MNFIREQSRRAIYHQHEWHERDENTFNDNTVRMIRQVYNNVRHVSVRGDQRRPPPSTNLWVTDASPQAVAGFTNYNDAAFVLPLQTSARGILPAELLGGLLAALLFKNNNDDGTGTWITDNMAAHYGVLKAHSANELSDIILCAWILLADLPDHVAWVPTKCQPADPLTRLHSFPAAPEQLLQQLAAHQQECDKCTNALHDMKEVPRWRAP